MKVHNIAIVGATGYTGVELLRILAQHPNVKVCAVCSRSNKGTAVADMFSSLRGHYDLAFSEPDLTQLKSMDLVFFATPNGVAMNYARELQGAGVKVIDLAADFRMRDLALWQQWYGMEHACPEMVERAVYGMPELNKKSIQEAQLVANPGCHVTAVSLGLLPLMKHQLVDDKNLIADSKSGISGAGRSASVATLMAENTDSFKAYKVDGHRHMPEIAQVLSDAGGQVDALSFVPHLVPMIRGIHATLYADLHKDMSAEALTELYQQYYKDAPFVDVLAPGEHPETRSVKGSNVCRISVNRLPNSNKVVVLSVIDNLVKGASGQAVQNMNLMLGLDEQAGLAAIALMP